MIKEAQALLQKSAQLDVLLSSIAVGPEGTTVHPANCPGKGRSDKIGLDAEGRAACVFNNTRCPFFVGSDFALEDYTKSINCMVDEI